ncbi:MAG: hypothetical protein AAFR61_20895 [Bacteroidota bacterium]
MKPTVLIKHIAFAILMVGFLPIIKGAQCEAPAETISYLNVRADFGPANKIDKIIQAAKTLIGSMASDAEKLRELAESFKRNPEAMSKYNVRVLYRKAIDINRSEKRYMNLAKNYLKAIKKANKSGNSNLVETLAEQLGQLLPSMRNLHRDFMALLNETYRTMDA